MRHPSRWAALVVLGMLLLASPAMAQEADGPKDGALTFQGQISGTIYTHAKGAVSGTSVAVLGAEGSAIHGSSTDPRGRYALKGLPRDDYAVLVMDPDGTLLRKDKVSVRPLFRNLVDFVMDPPGSPQPILPSLPGGKSVDLPPFDLAVTMLSREGVPISEAWFTASPLREVSPARRARSTATGQVRLEALPAGYYRFTARALGHVTWSLGPVLLRGNDKSEREILLTLMPFPLGHQERIENLLVPISPAAPESFEEETAPAAESAAAEGNTPDPPDPDC